jgi:acetate kinase
MTDSATLDCVLLLNAGSTSVKLAAWSLAGAQQWAQHLEGNAAQLSAGLQRALASLPRPPVAVLQRIVHAGAMPETPLPLDAATRARIAHWAPLAPLHNPLALALVDAVQACWPAVPQWAVFDSGLYAALPEVAARYALPDTLSPRWPLRRYGFHGLAHRSQWRQVQPADGSAGPRRLITLQLGGGCSLTAWKDDRVVDTSMGFTPLEGLVMATRSGTLDPGILLHLLQQEGMSVAALQDVLLHEAGLAAMAPGAGDMRALLADASPQAQQALAHYVWQIRKAIGAAVAVLGGLDALCIGGGVGEHQSVVRARILEDMSAFGIALDAQRNACAQGRCALQVPGSAVALALTPVNEMAEMFRQFADMRGVALPSTSQETCHA